MHKQDVVKYFGTQEKTANFLGISRTCVTMWPPIIPVRRALHLDAVTELEFDKRLYQSKTPEA
jgi:hypothetical protein